MIKTINSALSCFLECFSRRSAFGWFVTVVIGMMIRSDKMGVTSVIRALGLAPWYDAICDYSSQIPGSCVLSNESGGNM